MIMGKMIMMKMIIKQINFIDLRRKPATTDRPDFKLIYLFKITPVDKLMKTQLYLSQFIGKKFVDKKYWYENDFVRQNNTSLTSISLLLF